MSAIRWTLVAYLVVRPRQDGGEEITASVMFSFIIKVSLAICISREHPYIVHTYVYILTKFQLY